MEKEEISLIERPAFIAGITAVGGFCNAYTGMTRGGVFANAHTANMAKLGIAVATLNAWDAFNAVVPIVGCFLGAFLCELIKGKDDMLGGHWHRYALWMELAALVMVGFIPQSVPTSGLMPLCPWSPASSWMYFALGLEETTTRQSVPEIFELWGNSFIPGFSAAQMS